jgi:hypothetical protein
MTTRIVWPVIAVCVCGLLYLTATLLDSGGESSRDWALLIGAPTLYVLLPISVLWLVVVLVRSRRRVR